MMKFSRSYDRSVLIYREEGPQGRILLRLGRTFEDGECKPNNPKSIPENFELLTYIVAKDPEALLEDISNKFTEYLDDESNLAFHSVMFDALKLHDRIQQEQAAPGESELIRSLDVLYGKQVMEILLAATTGRDGRRSGKNIQAAVKRKYEEPSGILQMTIVGFAFIVAVPTCAIIVFRPDLYQSLFNPPAEEIGESAILNYADRMNDVLTSDLDTPVMDPNAMLMAEALTRKQDLFLVAGLGELSEDHEFIRNIPGYSQEAPETEILPADVLTSQLESQGPDAFSYVENPDLLEPGQADTDYIVSQDLPPPGAGAVVELEQGPDVSADASVATSAPLTVLEELPETEHNLPQHIASFSIKEFSLFNAGDPTLETSGQGITATYDVARRPATIFEVVRGDLSGIGQSLDNTVAGICDEIFLTADTDTPLRTANVSFDLGSSPFISTTIDAGECEAGQFAIFPLFDLDLSVE
jgi:hypothetical protein